jgi:hypothetical protein
MLRDSAHASMDKGCRVNEFYISASAGRCGPRIARTDDFLDHRMAAMSVWNCSNGTSPLRETNMSIKVEWACMSAPELRAIAAREGASPAALFPRASEQLDVQLATGEQHVVLRFADVG